MSRPRLPAKCLGATGKKFSSGRSDDTPLALAVGKRGCEYGSSNTGTDWQSSGAIALLTKSSKSLERHSQHSGFRIWLATFSSSVGLPVRPYATHKNGNYGHRSRLGAGKPVPLESVGLSFLNGVWSLATLIAGVFVVGLLDRKGSHPVVVRFFLSMIHSSRGRLEGGLIPRKIGGNPKLGGGV